MKKHSKAILITLSVVVLLGLGAIVGLQQYLQSSAGKARIEKELSRALRAPLTIEKADLKLGDLQMGGITIRDGDTKLLEVSALRARYRVWPLLRGTFHLYEVSVENPKIVWEQNAEGKWSWPPSAKVAAKPAVVPEVVPLRGSTPTALVKAEATTPAPAKLTVAESAPAIAAAAPAPPIAVPAATTTPSESPAKSKPAKPSSRKKSRFQIVVEGGQLRGGSVQLLNKEQDSVATITGIRIDFANPQPDRAEGLIEVARGMWGQSTALEKLRVPFAYADGKLVLPEVTGIYGDGPFTGSASWNSGDPGSPFVLALKFDQVDLVRLTRNTDEPLGQASGTLSGNVNLSGSAKRTESMNGTIRLTLREGRFRDFLYFTMIGEPLGIEQLKDFRPRDFSADLRLAEERVFLEDLTLDATDLQLRVKGAARFDGKMEVAARLMARPAATEHMPASVRDRLTANGDTPFIDFKITGKTHKPKTDLADRLASPTPGMSFDDLVAGILEAAKKKAGETKAKGKRKNEVKAPNDDRKSPADGNKAASQLDQPPSTP